MRFVPVGREEYAALAAGFNPTRWDPDAIVRLAEAAGMKFIVLTAKHHDGFNLFRTRQSAFNVVDASPYGRDIVKGLAEACERRGMTFGVYYSTIDWHDPRSIGPSRHPARENDEEIPPAHEEFNVAQLRELASGYGPLAEIWFDMGRPTPAQSRRFAETVHGLQPRCMVSGRVFNHQGDFTVMGDNRLPVTPIDEPWQTPGSIFSETWGYRSWQERTDLEAKTREHILRLVRVVSRGGNYLLNIGPRGDGSLVEFEAAVLEGAGRWLKTNGEAIYGAEPQPFRQLDFGYATVKPGRLYLMVERRPAGGRLTLPGLKNRLTRAWYLADAAKRQLSVDNTPGARAVVAEPWTETEPATVVVVEYEGKLDVTPPSTPAGAGGVFTLEEKAADRFLNYNGEGYYDPPTVYKLRWDIAPGRGGAYRVSVRYRHNAAAGPLEVAVGGRRLQFALQAESAEADVGVVDVPGGETAQVVLTPRHPFRKGDKLGVEIERIVLRPAR
jgi:alpha-L-fucosidase